MNELPHDMKDYAAPLGAFQLISPDAAIYAVCCIVILAWILEPVLR